MSTHMTTVLQARLFVTIVINIAQYGLPTLLHASSVTRHGRQLLAAGLDQSEQHSGVFIPDRLDLSNISTSRGIVTPTEL